MSSFSAAFLEQLRAKIRLSDLIGTRVKLVKRGREYQGLCPFHHEKTPSFTVNDEKEFYHCFGCGAHGDAVTFLTETQNYSFREAVEELAQRAGVEIPKILITQAKGQSYSTLYDVIEKATIWFQNQLKTSHEAQSYLKRRGLEQESIDVFRLGYAPSQPTALKSYLLQNDISEELMVKAGLVILGEGDKRSYDRFRGRLIFPIKDTKGRVVAFGGRSLDGTMPKYLNSPESPLFTKGSVLYNFDSARQYKNSAVILVEGYMDVIALHQVGYKSALAPLGTALTEEQILLSWRLSSEPILCFDGDEAGMRAALRAVERALPLLKPGHSLQFVFLPKGEDPDSLVKGGKENLLKECLSSASPFVDVLWLSLTLNQSFSTPEKRALLQQQMEEKLAQIKSSLVRSEYRYALKDRFYQTFLKRNTKTLSTHSPKSFSNIHRKSLGESFNLLSYQIIFAILLNHPHLLDEVVEEVAQLDIQDPELINLRNHILTFVVACSEGREDINEIKRYLNTKGCTDVLNKILSSETYLHASFAKETANFKEAREGFYEIYQRFQHKIIKEKDLSQIQNALQEELTTSTWEKLKELQKLFRN